MEFRTAERPRKRIGDHVLERLAEGYRQTIGNAVAVHVVHRGLQGKWHGRFLKMDIRPGQRIVHAAAVNREERIDHGGITHHVETRITQRIRRNRRYALVVLIQEAQRESRVQVQFLHAVHVGTRFHLAADSRPEQERHPDGHRIGISHVRKERIVLSAVASQQVATERVTRRIEESGIRHMEHVHESDIRKRIFRHRESHHLVLAGVRLQEAIQGVLARTQLARIHEGRSVDLETRHVLADENAAVIQPRLKRHAVGREASALQDE